MSNPMRFTVFLLCCIAVARLSAQPSFTYADFAPQPNDQYTVGNANYFSPGGAGANQTWNFTSASINSTATYTVEPISNIPCGSQYPSANVGIGLSGYEMMQITATEYNCYGNSVTPGMTDFIYSDPEKRFAFPMNYQSTFTDVFSGIATSLPPTRYRTGGDTVTYDGYGTLVTPTGSYTNAVRIHKQITWIDSTQTGSDTCSGDYYYWFVSGYRYPVVQMWWVNCTGGNSMGTMFLQSIAIGMEEEMVSGNDASVYPNPTTGAFTVYSPASAIGSTAQLADVTGRIVREFVITAPETKFDISGLDPGVYFISVNTTRGIRLVKTNPL